MTNVVMSSKRGQDTANPHRTQPIYAHPSPGETTSSRARQTNAPIRRAKSSAIDTPTAPPINGPVDHDMRRLGSTPTGASSHPYPSPAGRPPVPGRASAGGAPRPGGGG